MTAGAARLRWLCRRGMKELDVVLTSYLEHRYASASGAQQQAFERLLELQDPTVFALLLGRETSSDGEICTLVKALSDGSHLRQSNPQ